VEPFDRRHIPSDAEPGTSIPGYGEHERRTQLTTLPSEDAPITFQDDIKPLFRERDRRSMVFAFDLWCYDDVSRHSDGPRIGPWPRSAPRSASSPGHNTTGRDLSFVVGAINRLLRGWGNYFRWGNSTKKFGQVDIRWCPYRPLRGKRSQAGRGVQPASRACARRSINRSGRAR
jgi:hypothetical protein